MTKWWHISLTVSILLRCKWMFHLSWCFTYERSILKTTMWRHLTSRWRHGFMFFFRRAQYLNHTRCYQCRRRWYQSLLTHWTGFHMTEPDIVHKPMCMVVHILGKYSVWRYIQSGNCNGQFSRDFLELQACHTSLGANDCSHISSPSPWLPHSCHYPSMS